MNFVTQPGADFWCLTLNSISVDSNQLMCWVAMLVRLLDVATEISRRHNLKAESDFLALTIILLCVVHCSLSTQTYTQNCRQGMGEWEQQEFLRGDHQWVTQYPMLSHENVCTINIIQSEEVIFKIIMYISKYMYIETIFKKRL